ncbi:MAG: DUF1648 domain-containing protein, partial [Clostridiaceae bacterium]
MKIEKNKFDTLANIFCWLLLIGVSLYLFVSWDKLPQEVPGHYNGAGEADIISSKDSLIFPLVVAWILFIG